MTKEYAEEGMMKENTKSMITAGIVGAITASVVSVAVNPRPAPAQGLVPTFDGGQIAQLIDTATSAYKQIQALRQLGQGFVDFKDSIGSISDVADFKSILSEADKWRSITTPKWLSNDNMVTPDPDKTGPQGPTGNEIEELPVIARGGAYEDWDRDEAIDRPKLENAKQATQWTLDELYGTIDNEWTANQIRESERIRRMRGRIMQATARTAYIVGVAAPGAMKEYEEERNHLIKQLDSATSLREEVSVAAMAMIAGLAARSEQVLINGIALELQAMEVLLQGPPLLTEETKERLLNTTTSIGP